MGKIDIDFQVLHDAFFKHQTKPKMTGHGDLYYEGKEFEVDLKEKKAGILSDELKIALGMTSDTVPPPWLVNMQRYGPPPSYPTLRIPGLNAPIPSGAQFGFHVGGWGKPPVDEYGRSLYGDVFGVFVDKEMPEEQVDKTFRWGAIASGEGLSEADDDDEEAEDEGELAEGEDAGFPAGAETPTTLQGISSMASGLETPSTIDLRKRMGTETPDTVFDPDEAPKELYHVIQERQSSVSGQLFGSDRAYKLPGASAGAVSAELEDKEDVGDKRKQMSNKKGESLASNAAKKYKDFKF